MNIIEVENLCKTYRITKKEEGIRGAFKNIIKPTYEYKKAVKDISFSIKKGEMVGFIGPNGAGKSTTVKMLSGILYPTSGTIKVNNYVPYKQRKEYVKNIGVVFGQRSQLWYDLPIVDTFQLLKRIYKVPDKIFKENLEIFNELLGLKDFSAQPVRQLSLGQRMRAEFAAALLHSPDIVFFDEPTIGLDVVAKQKVREFITFINKEKGTTMLFTTHDMQDIEKTCGRIIIIDKGDKVYDGSIENIKGKYGRERVLIAEFAEKCQDLNIKDVVVADLGENKKKITFNKDKYTMGEIITQLTSKYTIVDLTVKEPEIESIICGIYEGGI